MKLSGEIGNSIGIVLFNLSGGSTLQWGAGRVCLAALVVLYLDLGCELMLFT